jgi:hypothetical protein
MSDRSKDDDRDRPLTSDELLKRAKRDIGAGGSDEIDRIVSDLDDIEVEVPVADEFPKPIPRMETRPTQPQRPRRVISAYDGEDDPFDRDDRPTNIRAVVVAITALLLLAIGGVIAFVAATTGM